MMKAGTLSRPAQMLAGLLVLGLLTGVAAAANVIDEVVVHPAIPLLDEDGNHVLDSGQPYSSRTSCGTAGCHDYDSITHAFHIEQGRDEANDAFGVAIGLSTLAGPGYFGGYNCMGGNNPERLALKDNASADEFGDLGAAGWIQRCASCHSGGGWMEKDRNGRRYDAVNPASVAEFDGDYYNRGTDENNQPAAIETVARWDWQKSGVVENDCLICHVDFNALKAFGPQPRVLNHGRPVSDPLSQWKNLRTNELIKDGLFRYTNSAILGYINLNLSGDAAADQAVVGFAREADKSLSKDADGLPVLNWNAAAFDARGKVAIPMLRFPGNDNCMMCHLTANSRRGFYGFGEGAAAIYDEAGVRVEDYQDDVHKGLTWTEANGEGRAIENCNACHARNYYKRPYESVDLDASHDFLKGNSDMDVRNDLDYQPGAKSCEYCHDDAENAAIPSGQADMLSAHRERWKAAGDMAGYTADSLTRITQTHLDVISCQACHITGKQYAGRPMKISYRYRAGEDGKLKITPYSARARYYWKDRNSGRILSATERNSVFRMAADNSYAEIVHPGSGQVLGQVTTYFSHGAWRYKDPADYEGFVALKQAYDALLAAKGVSGPVTPPDPTPPAGGSGGHGHQHKAGAATPDAVLVWTEPNSYLMSHNTRPAVASVQCEQCHARKQNGSFSALVSTHGLLGEGSLNTVATVPDPRLVEEGIIVLDLPYMKLDALGGITENAADILYATKLNPSMSILNAAVAKTASGVVRRHSAAAALADIGISDAGHLAALQALADSGEFYVFRPNQGDASLRQVAIMPPANQQTALVFPSYRMQVALAADAVVNAASGAGHGGLVSAVYSLGALDSGGAVVSHFGGTRVLVKLPYSGTSADPATVHVITSSDGSSWSMLDPADVVAVQPGDGVDDGYVVFSTGHFSYYAVSDLSKAAAGASVSASSSGGGGGGASLWLPLLGLAWLLGRARRRRAAPF